MVLPWPNKLLLVIIIPFLKVGSVHKFFTSIMKCFVPTQNNINKSKKELRKIGLFTSFNNTNHIV